MLSIEDFSALFLHAIHTRIAIQPRTRMQEKTEPPQGHTNFNREMLVGGVGDFAALSSTRYLHAECSSSTRVQAMRISAHK